MLADRGCDADWFREGLKERDIEPFFPSRRNRIVVILYASMFCRAHHKIENMFGRLKDWLRVAPRHDRCPIVSMSFIALAATVNFWLRVQSLGKFPEQFRLVEHPFQILHPILAVTPGQTLHRCDH